MKINPNTQKKRKKCGYEKYQNNIRSTIRRKTQKTIKRYRLLVITLATKEKVKHQKTLLKVGGTNLWKVNKQKNHSARRKQKALKTFTIQSKSTLQIYLQIKITLLEETEQTQMATKIKAVVILWQG